MAELEAQDTIRVDRATRQTTDLMVAIPAPIGSDALSVAVERVAAARKLVPAAAHIVLALPAEAQQDSPREFELAGIAVPSADAFRYVNYPWPASSPASMPWLASANTSRAILALAAGLDARACTLLGPEFESAESKPGSESMTTGKLTLMLGPGLEGSFDLVLPLYTTQPFDDLLNKSILYPLTCALYGHRVRNPLGSEMQASSRMYLPLTRNAGSDSGRQQSRLLWPATLAANLGLKICQVHVGIRHPRNNDGIELSDALAQLAGPLFLDMEDNAAYWQRIRGSHEVPVFGTPEPALPPTEGVDLQHMVDAYHLGVSNLREIWTLILPPATLLELKKLAQLPTEKFLMPDSLWARIVYDFALAHRLRNIHRSHLFGALTPLYLGWVASYAREINVAGHATAAERVEQLARAYEAEKPYLLSRWRWPDRFHP